jgi:hypothetical protein
MLVGVILVRVSAVECCPARRSWGSSNSPSVRWLLPVFQWQKRDIWKMCPTVHSSPCLPQVIHSGLRGGTAIGTLHPRIAIVSHVSSQASSPPWTYCVPLPMKTETFSSSFRSHSFYALQSSLSHIHRTQWRSLYLHSDPQSMTFQPEHPCNPMDTIWHWAIKAVR